MIKLEVLFKAVKEPAREIIMAIIPGLLLYFEKLNTTEAMIAYLVIRGIDSYLHENAKTDKTALVKGLTF